MIPTDLEKLSHGDTKQDEQVYEIDATPEQREVQDFEVSWSDENDQANPRNWSIRYKVYILLSISWSTLIGVIGATAYTSGISQMQHDFPGTSETVLAMGLSTYLLGWVFGSLLLAPLSEMYGRRPIYLVSTAFLAMFMVPCALVPSIAGEIVVRFFAGLSSAGCVALSPGTIRDVANEGQMALAFSFWSLGPFTATTIGPIVGGFTTQYLGWRYINWFVLAGAGVALLLLLGVRETYAPVLLRREAERMRTSTGERKWWSRFDSELDLGQRLKMNLTRPFILALTEPMLILWNLYIGFIYGVLYLSFTAYPVVFEGIRGWSISHTGMSFLGLLVGTFLAIISEPLTRRIVNSQRKDPLTGRPSPEATVSIVCVSAVLLPIGEFWFAWTAGSKSIYWVWPILGGIPFGLGATLNFIYALNYLARSYGIYAASVLAGNTVVRCILGAFLPLAGPTMIANLGVGWACSLLGFILVAMAPLPFLFYQFGARIRQRSQVIREAAVEEARLAGQSRSQGKPQ